MKEPGNELKKEIRPVRLHLELRNDYLSDDQKRMLGRYGEAPGGVMTRDILIPSDMPLHNLHYAIQQLFGWKNSHLRKFLLPEEIYMGLTKGTLRGWSDLVGVLFQPPSEGEGDLFWDDDYETGSIRNWLKKKYTGPYTYGGAMEDPAVAREDIHELLASFIALKVREPFSDYMERVQKGDDPEIKILREAPLVDLTLEEMDSSTGLDSYPGSLLERLEGDQLLAAEDGDLGGEELFPVTRELIYTYDYGDNWEVFITKFSDCDDLLEDNLIGRHELEEARKMVVRLHRPVCIARAGVNVVDDVGGLGGFADLLETLYEGEDKQEVISLRTWARSAGWSTAKTSLWNML